MFWTAAKSDIEDPLMHELVMDVASQMSTIMLHARFSVDSHFENLVHAGVKDAGKDNYSCYLPSIRHEGMVADGLLVKSAFNMINKQNDKTKLFALGLTGVDMNDRSDQVSVAKLLGDNLMEPSSFMVFVDPTNVTKEEKFYLPMGFQKMKLG